MKARTLTLLGALAVGQSVAPAQPGALPGPRPVPSQGAPGAVAGFNPAYNPALALQPGMGLPVPAPLVAAKFLAPKDVRVTAYPGSPLSHMYPTPTVMGLRPGYVYRFELSNLPYHPDKSIYPEVELRGTLVPRPGMKYMDYPIPLTFSQADIE